MSYRHQRHTHTIAMHALHTTTRATTPRNVSRKTENPVICAASILTDWHRSTESLNTLWIFLWNGRYNTNSISYDGHGLWPEDLCLLDMSRLAVNHESTDVNNSKAIVIGIVYTSTSAAKSKCRKISDDFHWPPLPVLSAIQHLSLSHLSFTFFDIDNM